MFLAKYVIKLIAKKKEHARRKKNQKLQSAIDNGANVYAKLYRKLIPNAKVGGELFL